MRHVRVVGKSSPSRAEYSQEFCDAKAVACNVMSQFGVECPSYETKCGSSTCIPCGQ